MLTVVAAAVIGRSCSAGNKADIESGAVVVVVVVVVVEYSIIELPITVAICIRCSHDAYWSVIKASMHLHLFTHHGKQENNGPTKCLHRQFSK